MRDYDAIVTGGGIVGISTALALAAKQMRVLVIESRKPKPIQSRLGFDLRTIALSPASVDWLQSLVNLRDLRQSSIQRMRVWEELGTAQLTFDAEDIGARELARIFEHSALAGALWNAAQRSVDFATPAQIARIEINENVVKLDNGDEFSTNLLIIAEGPQSSTRDMIGVHMSTFGRQRRALATIAKISEPHQGTAWQRFGEGTVALLPLQNPNLVSVIWSISESRCAELERMREEEFSNVLQRECESICGDIKEIDDRRSFPISQQIIRDFNPESWVLVVGDAARTIHPLAGLGVNLGIEDAKGVDQLFSSSADTTKVNISYRRFAAKRRVRSQAMIATMSALQWSYELRGGYGRWLRNISVRTVGRVPHLKHQLIREAMGIGPIAQSA